MERGSTHKVAGWVRFNGPVWRHQVAIQIPEAGIDFKTLTDEKGYAAFAFDASVLALRKEVGLAVSGTAEAVVAGES